MKAQPSKLLAEWFWTDRWTGSSGFHLPLHARGLYREMLTQAWRRAAKLPSDPETICRICGVTEKEWHAAWPLVSKFWRLDKDANLVNDTQLGVYKDAQEKQEKHSEAGRIGAQSRWQSQSVRNAVASTAVIAGPMPSVCPPSPSPSPSPISDTVSVTDSEKKTKIGAANGNGHEVSARSKRPIYQSDRFVVFEWQLDDLGRMLGPHTIGFDLHHFFDDLSQSSRTNGMIIPANSRNGQFWEWLQAEVKTEAQRRGLQFAEVPFEGKLTKQLRHATEESIKRHGARPRRISSNI